MTAKTNLEAMKEDLDELRIVLHQQDDLLCDVGEFLWKLQDAYNEGNEDKLYSICDEELLDLIRRVAPEGPERDDEG